MRAVVVVMSLAASAVAAPTSVAVDVSQLDTADAPAIEQALVARLVQEGFAVVPRAGEPTIVLAISARDGELVVAAKSPHFDRARAVDARTATGSQLHLELVQKAVELARLAAESIPPPPRADREVPGALPPLAPDETPPPAEPRWILGIDGGVLARGASDGELAVRARFAVWRDIGAAVQLGGSQSSAGGVDVRELHALVGISDEWTMTPRLTGEVSLLAGIRQHHFESTMPIVDPAGDRLDPQVALRIRIGVRPLRALDISAWVTATITKARAHVLGTEVLWQRDGTGLGGGLGAATRF